MNVFDLFATLSLDSTNYEEGLSGAESSANSFGSRLSGGLASAARVGAAAVAATTAAVVAGSTAFVNGVANVAEYADNIDKMSQKLGMSAEAYQEWDFIMQHAGTSIESMQASMKTLASAAESGNDAFEQLGMTQEQIASMSQEELFGATIEALQNVEDDTQRTYLAGQLLGRGATELGALLNMSAEDVENMRQEVHDLGGVMSDEAVSAGAQYQDSLQNLQTALGGVRNSLLSDFMPSFTSVMDGLSAIFSGDEGGLEMVQQGVNDFAEQMNETLPTFINLAGNIIGILGQAIIDNLPTLIDTGSSVIGKLGEGIISNLPAIISAAVEIIGRITMGLIEAAPQLLEAALEILNILGNQLVENLPTIMGTITQVVVELVNIFTQPDNLAMMIDLSLRLIMAVADGLVQAMPQLASVIPTIIANLVVTIINEFPNILSTVGSLLGDLALMVLGLVGGLMGDSYEEVMSKLTETWDFVSQSFSDFITGLTEWISNIGENITQLWTNIKDWFTDGISNAMDALGNWWDEISEWFTNLADNGLEWAGDLIDNFVSGLMGGISRVGDAVSGIADEVRSFLGFSEPEQGSLSNFHTFAPDMVDLFAQGIDESIPTLERSLSNMSDFVADNMPTLDMADITSRATVNVDSTGNASNQPIVVQAYFGNEKFDEYVIDSNQRTDFISGGRA